MSIGFLNYDSSFFQLEIESIKDKKMKQDISERIISLEIVEEMGKIITGNVQLLDDDDLRFTNSLKGKRINVKWGYSRTDLSGQQAFRKKDNPKELFSSTLVNRYTTGYIKNISGGGDENGVFTFNCQFMGREFEDNSRTRKAPFSSGTKGDVVSEIFTAMGIDTYFIDFRRQNEKLTRDTAIRQTESNFRFLAKYAQEWRAMFRIATSGKVIGMKDGIKQYGLVGLFCDYDKDASVSAFLKETLGATGDSCSFEYKKSGSPNVKSYTWQYHQGQAGSGDNVRVVVVNGKTEFYYMKADTEQVVYYKLNTKRMQREISSKKDLYSQTQWVNQMMKEAEGGMENLTRGKDPYFVPVNESTAPQGMGISATLEVIGNPLYTCPGRAKFLKGFPDFFMTRKGLTFYQTRVSHKINRAGYTCTIQVADAFTVSGGSLVG